jgi:hypothetical protein
VGWGFSERLNAQLVCDALKMALIEMGYIKETVLFWGVSKADQGVTAWFSA